MVGAEKVKKIFLARLRDQPARWKYPEQILRRISELPAPIIPRVLPRYPPDYWWEWQGALSDAKWIPDSRLHLVTRLGMPTSYAIGTVSFMGLELKVRPPILIPRADTEAWLAQLIPVIQRSGWRNILEVGFGSGCISLGLAKALGGSHHVHAIDRDRRALALALQNKSRSGLTNVTFELKSFADLDLTQHNYDLIISNPPYIRRVDRVPNVSPSTRRWESHAALHPDPEDDLTEVLIRRCREASIPLAFEFQTYPLLMAQRCKDKILFRDCRNRPRAILLQ